MAIYSHSRLSTFEQCPLKYKFRYIDKLKPDFTKSIEGFLGNTIHDVLEWIYKNSNERTFELDEIIQKYIEDWNKNFNNEIKIVKNEFTAEHYFNKGIRFLIDYFLTNQPFKDNTIATEKRIFINLDSEGKYKIQGYIDRIVHNKNTNVFEIHDYKTSASLKTQEELDEDRQLALYCLGVKDSYEHLGEIHLIWHFLDFNKKMISKRTSEQLEKLKQDTIQLINKIESTFNFSTNQGVLCRWCEFRSYCPDIKRNPL